MLADPKYQHLSSSLIKEVAKFGGDVSDYLPGQVAEQLTEKLRRK